MNCRERRCVARMVKALSLLTDPKETMHEFTTAVMDLNEAPVGHLCRVPESMAKKKLVERWYGDFEPELLKAHSLQVWNHPIWPFVKKVDRSAYSQVDVVGRQSFFDSEYGREFSDKLGVKDQHALSLRGSDGALLWGIGLLHYSRPRRASVKGLKILNELAADLGRGLEMIEAWYRKVGNTATVLCAFQELPEPYALISGGRLLFCSKRMIAALHLDRVAPSKNAWLKSLKCASSRLGFTARMEPFTGADGHRYRIAAIDVLGNTERSRLVRLIPLDQPSISDDRLAAAKAGLSDREAHVLSLMGKGLANKEIAHELDITYNTVRTLAQRIFAKLRVSGRIEALNAVRNS